MFHNYIVKTLIQTILLLLVLGLAATSCKKDKLTNPNEELVGDWILFKTYTPWTGYNTSSELKKTKWRFESDGTLKIYKNGIKQNTDTWERTYKVFYGQYIDSTETFIMDTIPALSISNQGTKPFSIDNDVLEIYESYIDGTDMYFERKK